MTADGNPPQGKWYHSAIVVLFLLFFVLGPFGLQILWKSPYFSKRGKWIVTVLNLLYTAAICWTTGSAIAESLKLLGQIGY